MSWYFWTDLVYIFIFIQLVLKILKNANSRLCQAAWSQCILHSMLQYIQGTCNYEKPIARPYIYSPETKGYKVVEARVYSLQIRAPGVLFRRIWVETFLAYILLILNIGRRTVEEEKKKITTWAPKSNLTKMIVHYICCKRSSHL